MWNVVCGVPTLTRAGRAMKLYFGQCSLITRYSKSTYLIATELGRITCASEAFVLFVAIVPLGGTDALSMALRSMVCKWK